MEISVSVKGITEKRPGDHRQSAKDWPGLTRLITDRAEGGFRVKT